MTKTKRLYTIIGHLIKRGHLIKNDKRFHNGLWEHTQNIKKDFPKHSLLRHYAKHHNKDPSFLMVCGIENISPIGEVIIEKGYIKLSQIKSRWIHDLQTLVPFGHNVD